MARQYITTAIDYPNAAPHMGHVLEKVLADVCARWFRLRGDEVRFQIGTDEHGIKMQRTADKEGVTPEQLLERNVPLFETLYDNLHLSHDIFIRTGDKKTHWPTVEELWKKLAAEGVLEKRSYTGLYCSGSERFVLERELVDGLCPDHPEPPEEVTEENWFLKMSAYGTELKNLLTQEWDGESYRIVPSFREKETLALIDSGLEDVSFSRPVSSLSWGIPVPEDNEQTMYVWCDALTNYISGLQYFGSDKEACHEQKDGVSRLGVEWWDDANVTHVIGKDIARFHALIWPLMLKKGGVRTPDTLLIHGFLTSEGQKMSKSIGNVVVPQDVLDTVHGNPDPLRFYLSHEVPVGRDGDFSWERFRSLYDAKLRNDIGNLLNRVLVLLAKHGEPLSIPDTDPDLLGTVWTEYREAMNAFDLSTALQAACKLASRCNQYIDQQKPWSLEGQEKTAVLSSLAEALRHISLLLLPFVPQTAHNIAKQLGVSYADSVLEKDFVLTEEITQFGGEKNWQNTGEPSILFAPLD